MEALLFYLIKSSALMSVFFLVYHWLLRKETFFNINRTFLLSGLIISVTLPLFFIKKIVLVDNPKISVADMIAQAAQQPVQELAVQPIQLAAPEPFDWFPVLYTAYAIIAGLLLLKVITNLISLYKLIHKQQIIKQDQFVFIDLNEDVSPFSFFKYIVYNSSFYTKEELESILNHEKVHSRQKHSLDILITRLFCIAFWFNPFVWLYKKAITQNLEYIADNKAIQATNDKRAYQIALLKVITNQNRLSITNNFYQSLIKKRIVMLNTNQSKKTNLWKYAFVLPLLAAFMLYFQVKVIAQEKQAVVNERKENVNLVVVTIHKNSTDSEIKKDVAELKKIGVTLKVSKVKRNNNNEITGIKASFKDNEGNKGVSEVDGTEPIKPIIFHKSNESVGFGTPNTPRIITMNSVPSGATTATGYYFSSEDSEAPEPQEVPEVLELSDVPSIPSTPEVPEVPKTHGIQWYSNDKDSINIKSTAAYIINDKKITLKSQKGEPIVIINGQLAENDILSQLNSDQIKNLNVIKNSDDLVRIYGSSAKNGVIAITTKDIVTDSIINKVKLAVKSYRIETKKEKAEKWPKQSTAYQGVIWSSRKEKEAAKAELEKAKAELAKAKAELEKTKAELKKQKR